MGGVALKVLLLAHRPVRRGAELFAAELASALESRGHEVRLAYLVPDPSGLSRLPQGTVVLGAGDGGPWDVLRAAVRLRRAISAFQPHIVQANGSRTVLVASLAARLSRGRRWTLVYRNIGRPSDWLRHRRHRWLYARWVMPIFDAWVALSEGADRELRDLYGARPTIRVIPGGVRVPSDPLPSPSERASAKRVLGSTPETFAVLYVGSLSPEKRCDRLIRGFARFLALAPGAQAELWLVGEGPERDALEAESSRWGVRERVRFFGVREDVTSFYRAADTLALASDTEGVPTVVLEAMAWGLPVVATDVGWVREPVVHGVTGFLVEPAQETAFARCLVELWQDPLLRSRMGSAGRGRVARYWDWENSVQQYEHLFLELAGRGGLRSGKEA